MMTENTTYAADLLKRMHERLHAFAPYPHSDALDRIRTEFEAISADDHLDESDEKRIDELHAEIKAITASQRQSAIRSLGVQLLAADGELLGHMIPGKVNDALESASQTLQSTLRELLGWLAHSQADSFLPTKNISPSDIAGLLAEALGWDDADVLRFTGAYTHDEFEQIARTFHDGAMSLALDVLHQAKRRAMNKDYESGVQDALLPPSVQPPQQWDAVQRDAAAQWLLLWGCAQWVVDDFLMIDDLEEASPR